ncbi:hypothetical protein BCR43DRAFT_489669 [Syncephalastrum racemosum]|uniref:Uncharacterized protein n=1 Tax=Syncephalastrum racemosum TaxID=13706 RepID=A0A1X2HEJ5_SYNRA|nr:hypothetical protein BCR43DRAFT_489669 [Syncephalastrum racemosum]
MENERDKFESAVRAQCDRDMQYLRCEIDALKQAHLQKVQSMADTIAHLQDTTESLRHQLRQHNITEEPTARSDEFHTRSLNTDDVEFFKKAYYHAKRLDQDEYLNNERWMTLQVSDLLPFHLFSLLFPLFFLLFVLI